MSDGQPPPPSDSRSSLAARLRGLLTTAQGALKAALALLYQYRRITLLTGLGLFILATGLATMRYVQTVRDQVLTEGLTTAAALEQLDAGEYAEARRLANLLPKAHDLEHEELGEVHFIIGAATAYETDGAWDEPNRARLYGLAARHLQQAQDRRFPAGREAEGRLLLARCLIEAGRYEQAIAPLLLVRDGSPALKLEVQRLLAIAYLKSHVPDLDRAAQHGDAYAEGAGAMQETREAAALLQSEIALARNELDRCESLLNEIPDHSHSVSRRQSLRGRLLIARAEALEARAVDNEAEPPTADHNALYEQAIERLREAQGHHASGQSLSSQASYLIGLALRRRGQLEAAQDQFFRTRKRYYNTPEGIVASLEEAEVLLELKQFEEATAAFERTAAHVASPDQFANPYISEKQLRERIEHGFELLYANQRFDLAANLSPSLAPLVGKTAAARLRADALHRWGNHLNQNASQAKDEEQQELFKASRKKYRLAGRAFAQLAKQHYVTREYPTDLWQSGHNFNLGRDYQSAVIVLNKYLTTEAQTERPLVLVALTQAYLSLNQLDEAIATIEECLRDFSRDPAVYRARLLASTAYVEQGDRDRAKELLEENLHHDSLTPRSDVWRDSLFALGQLLHDEGRSVVLRPTDEASSDSAVTSKVQSLERSHRLLHAAIHRLSEAVARYPDAEQAIDARYALGESYRFSSQAPLAKLQQETIESRRAALNRQIQDELNSALSHYDQLIALMNQKSHLSGALSTNEHQILRNAYFARGTCLYDLGDYEAAIKAYSTATSRYQHEPAALEAYIQIAACYRRLNKPLNARGTVEQAKLVMERVAEETDFTTTTRFDRDEWKILLNWLSSL